MDILNSTQSDILQLLARFKFLVISQMQPLLKKSIGYVRTQLSSMSERGYIGSFQLARPGKSENMYYLKESGKEIIVQHAKLFDADLKLPIGTPLLVKDFSHRKQMISLTIALYYHLLELGITVSEFISYFDKQGENRKSGTLEAKTKIPLGQGDNNFFIPDGIMLTQSGGKRTIYIIEMYCDSSSSRVIEQFISKHILCIAQGSPAKKFGIPANPVVLSAFENSGVKLKVIDRLSTHKAFQPFAHLFFFASMEDIKDCGTAWKDIHNNQLVFT